MSPAKLTQKTVSTSIFAFTRSVKGAEMSDVDIGRLVALLPFFELVVFQTASKGSAAGQLTDVPRQAIVQHEAALEGLMSKDELSFIWNAVKRRGSLRDQCLILILLQGARPIELSIANAFLHLYPGQGARMQWPSTRAEDQATSFSLQGSFLPLVNIYMNQANISPDDLLFPSKRDATIPMSLQEMSRVIGSYMCEALPDPSTREVRASSTFIAVHDVCVMIALLRLRSFHSSSPP